MSVHNSSSFASGLLPSLTYMTRQAVADPKIQRPIHRHDDNAELLFVYRGEGSYIVNGYTYPICPGDLLLYNRGDLHEVASATAREIGTFCFGIAGLALSRRAPGQMTDHESGFVRPVGARFDEVFSLCRLLYEQMEQGTPQAREIVGHLFPGLVLLALSFPADERNQQQHTDVVLAGRMRQHIATHFADSLTLESIAALLQVSPYYAAHIFKRITGYSPIQYMIRCRIGEAQNLLIATDYTATQIAAMVGYESAGHFSAIFTKTVGLPPIRYRRQYLARMQGKRGQ